MPTHDEGEAGARLRRWLETPSEHREEDVELRAAIERNLRGPTLSSQQLTSRPESRGPFDDAIARTLLPTTRPPTRSDWGVARALVYSWRNTGLTTVEISAWLGFGARPEEAGLVQDLILEGIAPSRATEVVEHPDTGERMTILELARRTPRPWGAQPRKELGEALDLAGVERRRLPDDWWRRASGPPA